jgi:hypothetical protein
MISRAVIRSRPSLNSFESISNSDDTIDTKRLFEKINKLNPEDRQALLAILNPKAENDSQSHQESVSKSTNSKKDTDKFMEEEKTDSKDYPYNSSDSSSYPKDGYNQAGYKQANRGYNNQDYGYNNNSKKTNRWQDDQNRAYEDEGSWKKTQGGPANHQQGFNSNREYQASPRAAYNRQPSRPQRQEMVAQQGAYREIRQPPPQVRRGPEIYQPVKPEEPRGRRQRQPDAILDNIRLRDDAKSVHMIFTKFKGSRYIDTIARDSNALDPKFGSKVL